ncbi:VC0807 family protein [Actinopolymorpha rutila]|uniref:Catechol 2,3-dioxygenase-like lactoylglutathione lyase family enzyme n=1 Tax=Actinopolymorpha rutila TaxID=446787 RepID=A0A852Z8P3_9ACTN|nr:VC0807 family protein [Actinopolymorpha rutila]NYH89314.1 catechol 2,3-dioxygenase-like lactoylglutathione lyase family enzyme [Actinopolymorpha rutila]
MTAPDHSSSDSSQRTDRTDRTEHTSEADALAAQPGGRPPFREILLGMVWDVVPSIAAYYACRALGASPYASLLAGTLVAGIRVAYVAIRARTFDAFAAFMVAIFGFGLVMSFVTGDERFLLAKESFGTGAAGLAFLGSCFVGRPLIFYAARRFSARTEAARAGWEDMWHSSPGFRRTFVVLSAGWGVGLLVEATLRVILVYLLPVDVMAGLSSVLGIAGFAVLLTWNMWYIKRVRARRAAGLTAQPRPAATATGGEVAQSANA